MGDFFRSEKMLLVQLYLHPDSLYYIITELGEAGVVQFEDLNSANTIRRKFTNELRRVLEMERRLQYIRKEILKYGVKIPKKETFPQAPHLDEIIDLETHLEATEKSMISINMNMIKLKSDYMNLKEMKYVLHKTQPFFLTTSTHNSLDRTPQIQALQFLTGTLPRQKVSCFELMIWRLSKGHVLFRQVDIEEALEDPVNDSQVYKTVFAVFFHGEQFKERIKKLALGLGGILYNRPYSERRTQDLLDSVIIQLEDLKMIVDNTYLFQERHLKSIAQEWQNWSVMVTKIKAIFHTMNCLSMDITNKCLIGEAWVPAKDIDIVKNILQQSSKQGVSISTLSSFLNVVQTDKTPPTYNRLNKFTAGFQNLIDSYGVATYEEVNPTLYTIVTFPFLFAVMFGDVGHAIILILFAVVLIIWEKKYRVSKPSNEILRIFYNGRYIILLMGLFSFYSGLLYNDFFANALVYTHSSWFMNFTKKFMIEINETIELDPATHYTGNAYIFGIDPVWHMSQNEIIFTNSMKMKMSIIFGVLQMTFGVCVSLINFIHFRQYSYIFLQFIPQLVFLMCLFGWMVCMIFLKWNLYSADKNQPHDYGTSCAPSILIYFINMMLFKPTTPPLPNCKAFMLKDQKLIQEVLIFTAITCIPILLFAQPTYAVLKKKIKRKKINLDVEEHHEHDSTSDIFIYQVIHTIEYVLGTVSHTASYLRLWALSLAHSQLSKVLWARVMSNGLKGDPVFLGGAMTFVCFLLWSFFTVAIMVTMEGLSAFLHTLRLHWVEYMSKFYMGAGYPFQPFSFKELLQNSPTED